MFWTRFPTRRFNLRVVVPLAVLAILGGGTWAESSRMLRYTGVMSGLFGGHTSAVSSAVPQYQVSQKGREFHPTDMTIKRGDTLEIVNDDGDLSHHAYVSSDDFNFDSGDQTPGSKTDVVFSVAGTFNVLCGIHPKMKLVVHVK